MNRGFPLLLLLFLVGPGCGPTSVSGHQILVSPETQDFAGIMNELAQSGYEWAWVKEGETAWVRWEGAMSKVFLRHYPQLQAISVMRILPKRKKSRVTSNFMIRLNYLNATGFLKGYLDQESDLWLQAFYPAETLLDLTDFQAFLKRFDEQTVAVAREFSDYLQVGD